MKNAIFCPGGGGLCPKLPKNIITECRMARRVGLITTVFLIQDLEIGVHREDKIMQYFQM